MSRSMSPRERVLTSLAHREPDHVPCWWRVAGVEGAGAACISACRTTRACCCTDDFRRVHSSYAGPQAAHPTANLSHPDATYRTPFGVERHGLGYGQPIRMPLCRCDAPRGPRLSLARPRVDGRLPHSR